MCPLILTCELSPTVLGFGIANLVSLKLNHVGKTSRKLGKILYTVMKILFLIILLSIVHISIFLRITILCKLSAQNRSYVKFVVWKPFCQFVVVYKSFKSSQCRLIFIRAACGMFSAMGRFSSRVYMTMFLPRTISPGTICKVSIISYFEHFKIGTKTLFFLLDETGGI